MRIGFSTCSTQTDHSYFDIRRMANAMDDTQGCAAFQTNNNLRPWELQKHPFDISDQQSC